MKWKILIPVIIVTILIGTKFVLWDFPISNGKRVGNLTKISKKGKFLPTWEGTIDEGSGDILTSKFSVRNSELAQELYNYEGKEVILYYDEYILGWPRDTAYVVTEWKPKNFNSLRVTTSGDNALKLLSKTLFCSLLGSLINNEDLYQKVKAHVKENNLYLFNQFNECNN
jgi:hypothetical protein